jgi:hypothetical protein
VILQSLLVEDSVRFQGHFRRSVSDDTSRVLRLALADLRASRMTLLVRPSLYALSLRNASGP